MPEFGWSRQDNGRTSPASIGARRVYAIGDIHGCAQLFIRLLEKIAADAGARPPMPHLVILLGDIVDRGPQSAQMVECAMDLARNGPPIRFIKGNHEEMFILAARGDIVSTANHCRNGGRETLLSYGLSEADYDAFDLKTLTEWMLYNVPRAHIDFLDAFEDHIEIGDYLFVHAGIRPNMPIARQDPADLRWIREEFLSCRQPHDKMVIHGHTISKQVDEQPNRIGIDTGAFFSGRLTAIGLEGAAHWYLDTVT